MSLGAILLAAAAILIALPATFRNPTGGALFLCWLFGLALEHIFGYYLSKPEMFYLDLFVIAVIMAKPEACNFRPYKGFWHQVRCIVLERSKWDQRIAALFFLAWIVYSLPLSGAMFWWALFAIAVLQYLCSAAEALSKWRTIRTANAERNLTTPPAGLEFARPAWGAGGGG